MLRYPKYDPKAINQKAPWTWHKVRWYHPGDWYQYLVYRFKP